MRLMRLIGASCLESPTNTTRRLASSDKAIVAYRRLLLRAIEQAERGERSLMVLDAAEAQRMRGPAAVDGIGPSEAWQSYWRENDRRRYAAVEAAKLGPAGVASISRLLRIDPKTVRRGEADLKDLPDLPPERVRTKGAAEKER